MKKAIYIHRSPDGTELINIIMEPWGKGITEEEAAREALELRLWLSECLPGHVYDKVTDRKKIERLQRAARAILINERHYLQGDEDGLQRAGIEELRKALNESLHAIILPEGEGSEDLLFKTADSMMRYYAEAGSRAFIDHFGSLDLLKVCERIIKEGEGNPHPWE